MTTPRKIKAVKKKRGALPVYTQLTQIIKEDISSGRLVPGFRIPSEAQLAKDYGVSPMTVRQAIGVLAEEGLVERVHGSGTYVKRIEVGATTFDLTHLNRVLSDAEALDVKVFKSEIVRASGPESRALQIEANTPVIRVERVVNHNRNPFCFQTAYLPFDPKAPVVESMLDTTGLSDLLFSNQRHGYKKGALALAPVIMDDRIAQVFPESGSRAAFKLDYMYFDFKDIPSAYGRFIIPPEQMPMVSQVGVWNDKK